MEFRFVILRYSGRHPRSARTICMRKFRVKGAANAGGTGDLPPDTVTEEVVGGHVSQDYSAFLEAFSAAPPDINEQEDTVRPGDEPDLLSPEAILQANEDFNALPEELQEMILASPTADRKSTRLNSSH